MGRLRIGTWNVEYAAGAAKNVSRLDRLRSEAADVWVLTETHDDLDLSATHHAANTSQRPTGRAGGRWTTIWTRWPIARRLDTADPLRTLAVEVTSPFGPLLVYGTVLPWGNDPGPDPGSPASGWAEMDRVLPIQLAEWRRLREAHAGVPLLVAGDLNMNLGGPHYYGTARCRRTLLGALSELRLACATTHERIPSGLLRHPPIDHVLVPDDWTTRVFSAWDGTHGGARLSDHSGLVVEAELGA